MWNHNNHFHPYLLRQLPSNIKRALDIGCGLGIFTAKLAKRSTFVDAIDIDNTILEEALNHNNLPNIYYLNANFLEADLPENSYDLIVSIASLHHINLEAALAKIKLLLRSSGKLLILGLYREKTIIDYLYSLISIPLNLIYLNWHRSSIPISMTVAPTRSAQLSLKQIKEVANSFIPGFRLKRHILWRYSLIWQKP